MTAILYSYKGPGRFGDKLIRWWTKSIYSHSEIMIDGVMYAASQWDGGVVARRFTPDPEKWDAIALVGLDVEKMRQFLTWQIGKRYDWKGIFLTQILPFSKHSAGKWFCSELAHKAMMIGGHQDTQPSHEIDPGELHDIAWGTIEVMSRGQNHCGHFAGTSPAE